MSSVPKQRTVPSIALDLDGTHIPEGVTVFKIRNGGNYDFESKKWLFSKMTGRMI